MAATAEYMASSAAASVAALTGLDFNAWGRALAVAAAIAVVWRLRAAPAVATPRLAGALAGALAFWALTGVARADIVPVGASRYTYGGALLLLLAAVELVQGVRIGSRAAAIAIAAGVAFASLAGYGQLYAEGRNHQVIAKDLEVELTALELARANVPPDLQWDPVRMPTILAGTYFAAVDDLGSPAPPLAQVRLDPEPRRLTFDRMSQSLDHARLDAAAPGTAGHETVVAGAGRGRSSDARRQAASVYSPAPQGGTIQVRVPAQGLLVTVAARARGPSTSRCAGWPMSSGRPSGRCGLPHRPDSPSIVIRAPIPGGCWSAPTIGSASARTSLRVAERVVDSVERREPVAVMRVDVAQALL